MSDGRQTVRPGLPPLASAVAEGVYCFTDAQQVRAEPDSGRLSLLCAGREKCLPEYHVAGADYPCVVVEFVEAGRGIAKIGDQKIDLYPGIVFSYGLDVDHDLRAVPEAPMTKYFAAYQRPPEDSLSRTGESIQPGQVRLSLQPNELGHLFEQLISEGRKTGRLHRQIVEKYLELILLISGEAASTSGSSTSGATSFQRVVACIEQHFLELHGLAELSRRVQLDAAYICRLFRRFGHETPHQSLTRHKLNRAAEMLVTLGALPVKEIASAVGYSDAFHFSRIFKRRFGDSPTSFRSRAQGRDS